MVCLPQFGPVASIRVGALLFLLWSVSSASSQTNFEQSGSACACPDGRQFSTGSSLFGKNSARVVITGFRRDLVQAAEQQGLPPCKDLMVVGQAVRLEVMGNHPFLRRENRKRGTIADICHTKIQFAEPKKSYDFFKDDGSAVTLSDMEGAQAPPPEEASAASSVAHDSDDRGMDDLTGRDLIRMIPREQQAEDPGSASFDVDDLKEGAYFIVRRQLKAAPAVDDTTLAHSGVAPDEDRELIVRAGSLGRIEKPAGFRNEALWLVEVLPHSAPVPFSSYLLSLPSAFRKHRPPQKKFVLASSDIVEINHFFDKYSLEWTRFGDDSDHARKRESAGTTVLPDLYSASQPALDENLENARNAGIENEIREAAMRLTLSLKDPKPVGAPGVLVLDEDGGPGTAAPHFFHKQCFVGDFHVAKTSGSPVFRVTDANLAIFQPTDSPQVPADYYAIDLRLQVKSDSGRSMPIVCRFPSAAIEETLLSGAERILSTVFSVASGTR
jgi:hypothetical protein